MPAFNRDNEADVWGRVQSVLTECTQASAVTRATLLQEGETLEGRIACEKTLPRLVAAGLPAATVVTLREKYGVNETPDKVVPWYIVFAKKFTGLSSFLLELIVALSLGLGKYTDAVIVGMLLVTNAVIGFVQDMRARAAVRALKKRLQLQARILRDGQWLLLPARELVPGDVVRLRIGDYVPADVFIYAGQGEVDESALTGESLGHKVKEHAYLYAGTILKTGEINAVVMATALSTFFGQTVKLVQESRPSTHADAVVRRVSLSLLVAVVSLLIVAIIVLLVRSNSLVDILPLLLMLLVSAVPVALPSMMTVAMAWGARQLTQQGVLVSRLHSIGDAARMQIQCLDKTGTLTKNELAVSETVIVPDPKLATALPSVTVTSRQALQLAAWCSRAENHDPIDTAVLQAAGALLPAQQQQENSNGPPLAHSPMPAASPAPVSSPRSAPTTNSSPVPPELSDLLAANWETDVKVKPLTFTPFDAKIRRTESVLQVTHTSAGRTFYLRVFKGATKTLLNLANHDLTSPFGQQVLQQVEAQAAQGYRTIGVAVEVVHVRGDDDSDHKEQQDAPPAAAVTKFSAIVQANVCFVGLLGLFDPPREDSGEIVAQLRELGVQVKMLTGDARLVAVEVAKRLKMGTNFHTGALPDIPEEVHAGDVPKELNSIALKPVDHDDDDWVHADGFAEIFPADKHHIVSLLQRKGFVVGMTGDGVNDAPALKQAELGIAMSNATDVAKGAASIVSIKEGLSAIVPLVRVGRQIHRRIQTWVVNKIAKTVFSNGFIVLTYLALGVFPVQAFHMVLLLLLVDFVTISLAVDRAGISPQPDHWRMLPLSKTGLAVGLCAVGEAFGIFCLGRYVFDLDAAQQATYGFQLLYFFGLLTTFIVRVPDANPFYSFAPAPLLFTISAVESAGIIAICSAGAPYLKAVPFWQNIVLFLLAASCCFVINDRVKIIVVGYLARKDAEEAARKAADTVGMATTKRELLLRSVHKS